MMAEYVLDVLSHSRKRAPIGHLVSFVFFCFFGRFEAPVILKRLLRRRHMEPIAFYIRQTS
jgi:hypothetical protein